MANANLLDFWKTLWHVDVYKDHENTYDSTIVNSFLPDDGIYSTDQIIDDYKISSAGQKANRNGGDGKVLGFEELFKYLTAIDLADIKNQPVDGKIIESNLNETIMGKKVNYQIQIFEDNGAGKELLDNISNFIGQYNISLFVDTSSHLSELIENYDQTKKIAYAYTREIESDPADKTTYLTIGKDNQKRFFYELEAPNNPTVITYPPYPDTNAINPAITDCMSYFYCKFPVFLSNNGIREAPKYNLKTNLSYVRNDGKIITVTDGANTAGAFDKFKNGLKKIAGLGSDKDMKQMVFISKHHGDVAQSLVKFRDVKMKCPKTEEVINTDDYKATFVSIDVNAIIKALTIETPFIFMYPPDKKRIIVWKNNTLNSPAIQFESEKKYTNELHAKLLISVDKYNTDVIHITINKDMIDAKIKDVLTPKDILSDQKIDYYANLYKETLKAGVHISTLLNYVPELNQEYAQVDPNTFNMQQTINKITIDGLKDDEIQNKINELKEIQKVLKQKESELVIPLNYRTILLEGGNLEPVSFEKDVIIEFKEFQEKAATVVKKQANIRGVYSFKRDNKKVDHMWSVTNLAYNIGDFSIDSLTCRFGTKMNISWAFDIIYYIYNNLRDNYKDNFIKTLRNIVQKTPTMPRKPTKMDTFIFGLSLIGIPLPIILTGGSETLTITETIQPITLQNQSKVIRLTNKKHNNLDEEKEPLEIIALKTEYNDIIAHLEFIIDIIYLYEYSGRIPETAFELFGLKSYDKFFKGVFGSQYQVSGQTLSGLSALRRQQQIKNKIQMNGGAKQYIAYQSNLIKEVFETEGIGHTSVATRAATRAEEKITPVFDDSNFLTSHFSIIKLYEEIVSKENEDSLDARIERIYSLRPFESRSKVLSELYEKKNYINSLINQIKDEEKKVWEEKKENPIILGIKRARSENSNEGNLIAAAKAKAIEVQRRNPNTGQSPQKKRRTNKNTNGGTRRKQKESKLKTFKKTRINKQRRTQRH